MYDDLNLSDVELKVVIEWLESKQLKGSSKCNTCGCGHWIVPPYLIRSLAYSKNELPLGGPTYVFVMVSCKNCGNTKFFNAALIGLIPSSITLAE